MDDNKLRQKTVIKEVLKDKGDVILEVCAEDIFWVIQGLSVAKRSIGTSDELLAEWEKSRGVFSAILLERHPELAAVILHDSTEAEDARAILRMMKDRRRIEIKFSSMVPLFHIVCALQIACRAPMMEGTPTQAWEHFGKQTTTVIGARYPDVVGILELGWYPAFDKPLDDNDRVSE